MKRPAVTMEELWAAQAQFGPFDNEVIRGLQREWDAYYRHSMEVLTSPAQSHTPDCAATAPTPHSASSSLGSRGPMPAARPPDSRR